MSDSSTVFPRLWRGGRVCCLFVCVFVAKPEGSFPGHGGIFCTRIPIHHPAPFFFALQTLSTAPATPAPLIAAPMGLIGFAQQLQTQHPIPCVLPRKFPCLHALVWPDMCCLRSLHCLLCLKRLSWFFFRAGKPTDFNEVFIIFGSKAHLMAAICTFHHNSNLKVTTGIFCLLLNSTSSFFLSDWRSLWAHTWPRMNFVCVFAINKGVGGGKGNHSVIFHTISYQIQME